MAASVDDEMMIGALSQLGQALRSDNAEPNDPDLRSRYTAFVESYEEMVQLYQESVMQASEDASDAAADLREARNSAAPPLTATEDWVMQQKLEQVEHELWRNEEYLRKVHNVLHELHGMPTQSENDDSSGPLHDETPFNGKYFLELKEMLANRPPNSKRVVWETIDELLARRHEAEVQRNNGARSSKKTVLPNYVDATEDYTGTARKTLAHTNFWPVGEPYGVIPLKMSVQARQATTDLGNLEETLTRQAYEQRSMNESTQNLSFQIPESGQTIVAFSRTLPSGNTYTHKLRMFWDLSNAELPDFDDSTRELGPSKMQLTDDLKRIKVSGLVITASGMAIDITETIRATKRLILTNPPAPRSAETLIQTSSLKTLFDKDTPPARDRTHPCRFLAWTLGSNVPEAQNQKQANGESDFVAARRLFKSLDPIVVELRRIYTTDHFVFQRPRLLKCPLVFLMFRFGAKSPLVAEAMLEYLNQNTISALEPTLPLVNQNDNDEPSSSDSNDLDDNVVDEDAL